MMNLLGSIYGLVVKTRNSLYDRRSLRSSKLAGPVVSVGNLSMGGSGKTPFVILLGQFLKERGIPIDILSRGYGRKTQGVLEVDPTGPASDYGDEPILIARKLGVPVIVGESRFQAGQYAEKKFGPQLHILDDGFQHRRLARDFDIVLLATEDFEDRLIPAGRLREPFSSLSRADAVVVSGESLAHNTPLLQMKTWHLRRSVDIGNVPENPVAFCGIAKPDNFFGQLEAAGIAPAAKIGFRDHHPYTQQDVTRLLSVRRDQPGAGFVTTEKDAINLGALAKQLNPLSVAKVIMELENAPEFLDTMLRVIQQRHPAT
jgi:tetraacyldisaccharide 4'-kinase